jgi:hypothetical protein
MNFKMALRAPNGFINVDEVQKVNDEPFNVIGVVSDFLPLAPTKGPGTSLLLKPFCMYTKAMSDHVCTFTLVDLTAEDWNMGLRCKYFVKPNEIGKAPKILGVGDVALLRYVKVSAPSLPIFTCQSDSKQMKEWHNDRICLSNHQTEWTVLLASTISHNPNELMEPVFLSMRPRSLVHPLHKQYMIDLYRQIDKMHYPLPVKYNPNRLVNAAPVSSSSSHVISSTRDKFSLLKDIQVNTFYDLVGHVVKIYNSGDRVTVYLSDYTSNGLFFNYEWGKGRSDDDQYGDGYGYAAPKADKTWPGPYGRLTIQITLWPPHSEFALNNIRPGSYVLLHNVHIKTGRDVMHFEGVMHGDRNYPSKINIQILTITNEGSTDNRLIEMLRRKKDYEKKAKVQLKECTKEMTTKKEKRKRNDPDSDDSINDRRDDSQNESIEEPVAKKKKMNSRQRKREVLRQVEHKEEEAQRLALAQTNQNSKYYSSLSSARTNSSKFGVHIP